ncbi:MAG TPA: DNA polymerase III subunit delta' [Burkholderiaceae bacterium]|nr:DNA polymerase III subunit delta' [Burkholderiaceae bacterium]
MAEALDRIRNLPWHARAWDELHALHARQVHAVLLHGAAGIGKKGLAFDFAASLLCESRCDSGQPCHACAGCALFDAGNHPDFRVLVPDTLAWMRPAPSAEEGEAEAEGEGDVREAKAARTSREIKIDPVRAIADLVGVSAHRGGARVVLLAPAESLTTPAANALLKMLEEPPPQTVFVLVADNLDNVLPTIRSRCVLLRVAPPSAAQALEWLRGQGIKDPESALAATGGAPLAALPADEDDEQRLDAATAATLLELLAAGRRLAAADVIARLPRTLPLGDTIGLFQRWAWDLLGVRLAGTVRYHPQRQAALRAVAGDAPVDGLLGWAKSLERARAVADHPLNARLAVEALLMEYTQRLTVAPR